MQLCLRNNFLDEQFEKLNLNVRGYTYSRNFNDWKWQTIYVTPYTGYVLYTVLLEQFSKTYIIIICTRQKKMLFFFVF